MQISDFVVIFSAKGLIVCRDMNDADMLIELYEIQQAYVKKYDFDKHKNYLMEIIEKDCYAIL